MIASAGFGAVRADAASSTFNPFDLNQGFTVVSQGDVVLSNSELEGSIAVFGSITSGNQNGYPVIHNAAGTPDYVVPKVDGVPVRILAGRFSGTGAFDLSNRDDSHTIAADSAEANAVAKIVDVSGLTGSARGGGSGAAAGTNFLRVTNATGGILDLKTVPFEGSSVADLATEKSSVASYFAGLETGIAKANQCLASLYAPDLGLANQVTVQDEGGLVYVSGFVTDRPNVIDYAAIAGKTVKLDRAGGYQPDATAPLIVRVSAGTTTLGKLQFEGWSAQTGAQQELARYILLDLSAVTGTVAVNGLEMGAIWAPQASLAFDSGTTTNGQWLAAQVISSGGGEIHHHAFSAVLPCAADEPATPVPTATEPTPTVDPTETTEPTPTVDPTETTEPTPTVDPTETTEPTPTVDPTETTEPTPTVDPTETTEPTVDPTETVVPTVDPTETVVPTVDPTETVVPTVDPTETVVPTVDPTETVVPTVDPTETVVPTVDPTSDTSEDSLAYTGAEIAWPLAGALVLLVLGVGALLISRPRTH